MIQAANEDVRESALTPTSRSRGAYAKYTPVQQVMMGECASMHSNQVAVCHFSKKLGVAAMAIVRRSDRSHLPENGGPISITPNWAKFLLYRLKKTLNHQPYGTRVSSMSLREAWQHDVHTLRGVVNISH